MFFLDRVTKSYDGKRALDEFTLDIASRKTTVLIGPSGCGKSTVFGVITGLLTPDSGEVYFQARPIADNNLELFRQRLGYVIQDGGLFPHLTGRQNVSLMARYLKWDTRAIRERIESLQTLTRLSPEVLDRYPSEMSGGQRQRVSLMRALMLDAEALLLDEPLGALDPMVRADLREELAEIFRRLGKTVVLVTHDLHEAARLADQIVLMKDGRVVQTGAATDLIERPADPFVTQFVNAQRDFAVMGEAK